MQKKAHNNLKFFFLLQMFSTSLKTVFYSYRWLPKEKALGTTTMAFWTSMIWQSPPLFLAKDNPLDLTRLLLRELVSVRSRLKTVAPLLDRFFRCTGLSRNYPNSCEQLQNKKPY